MKAEEIRQTEWSCHRILVVEDEPLIRHLNTRALMDAGYQVPTAEDGSVAWDALQLKSFDLLITDNFMPKVTGLELIEKVRAAGMALPVIMAAGVLPNDAFSLSPWLQPAAIVIKPYTRAEFLGAVQNVLCGTVPIVMWQSCEIGIPITLTLTSSNLRCSHEVD
jgi:two-component system, OmpR family, alkaline phosphatase synthesis response regulator PhoP